MSESTLWIMKPVQKIQFYGIILKHILIDGKSVYWKEWHEAGILRIKDLLDENNKFLTFDKFRLKTGLKVPFTMLYGLMLAIPYNWKCALRQSSRDNLDMEQNLTV